MHVRVALSQLRVGHSGCLLSRGHVMVSREGQHDDVQTVATREGVGLL